MDTLPPGAPVGVISPHLDDAVLSCAGAVAGRTGSRVVTVFSGGEPVPGWLPAWDKLSGLWVPGDDIMAARRTEDERAVRQLRAEPVHLGFADAQYRKIPQPELGLLRPIYRLANYVRLRSPGLARRVEEQLRAEVARSAVTTWLVPLGLVHVDHTLVGRVCRRLASATPDRDWLAYAELPYAQKFPSQVARALRRLTQAGWDVNPLKLPETADETVKRELVACYQSQLKALGEDVEIALAAPEMYFSLRRRSRPAEP